MHVAEDLATEAAVLLISSSCWWVVPRA